MASMSNSATKGSAVKRRTKTDTDDEMLRELVKVLCECLFRSRTSIKSASQFSQPIRKTKWFGIVSDRVAEVDRLMGKVYTYCMTDELTMAIKADWTPHLTTIVTVTVDAVLAECWSFRYTWNVTESRGRVYSKLMVLVRSLIATAQALPSSRNRSKNEIQVRFCQTDGEPFDVLPPLSEQFCFPSVDMSFGRVDVEVRYRNDLVVVDTSGAIANSLASLSRKEGPNILGPTLVEDYIGGGRLSAENDLAAEDDEDNRRWRRWASESFDERERELVDQAANVDPRGQVEHDDDDDGDVSAPPANTRVSSNPMAIPGKNQDHGGAGGSKRSYDTSEVGAIRIGSFRDGRTGVSPDDVQFASSAPATVSRISRKSSNLSEHRRESLRGHARTSSEEGPNRSFRYSNSFGYSVADLVAYSSTGTPILSSLPFAVGSLASSSASVPDAATKPPVDAVSLRTKFLSGNDITSTSPPFPVVYMSAGSLMVSRHSSALALLDNNTLQSPSPQLPGTATPPPIQNKGQVIYEAALPWVLTPSEMERPFSSMGASVTLGATLDDAVLNSQRDTLERKRSRSRNKNIEDIDNDDELTLPFVADEDFETTNEDNAELGAFVRRCREGRPLFVDQSRIGIDDVRKQLDNLFHQSGLDKVPAQIPEVVTVYEDRPL